MWGEWEWREWERREGERRERERRERERGSRTMLWRQNPSSGRWKLWDELATVVEWKEETRVEMRVDPDE